MRFTSASAQSLKKNLSRSQQGPDVRPPTVAEAVDWLKKMEHSPEYCRTCLTHWKQVMGVSAAKQVFEQSPESVKTWIKDRNWK